MTSKTPMTYDIRKPCGQCPFRKDAPKGVWHEDHYEMLRGLCSNHDVMSSGSYRTFACHGTRNKKDNAVCAGWMLYQREHGVPSIGLRLTLATRGKVAIDCLEEVASPTEIYYDIDELADDNIDVIHLMAEMPELQCEMSLQESPDVDKTTCPSCGQAVPVDGHYPVHLKDPNLVKEYA
jgi:hypothetical protein